MLDSLCESVPAFLVIMKCSLSPFLILSVIVCAAPQAFGAAELSAPLNLCLARIAPSETARAVRTTEDVKSFVQCAYDCQAIRNGQEVGFAEARKDPSAAGMGEPSTRTSAGEAARSMSSSTAEGTRQQKPSGAGGRLACPTSLDCCLRRLRSRAHESVGPPD